MTHTSYKPLAGIGISVGIGVAIVISFVVVIALIVNNKEAVDRIGNDISYMLIVGYPKVSFLFLVSVVIGLLVLGYKRFS
jgi:hypothetical protein